MGLFGGQDRRQVAVVITTDGRRVHLPVEPRGGLSLLVLLRSLGLGLESLIRLIGRSRREDRGTKGNG
ncbi:MAG: hypothetical protein RL338_1274 [Chloroflexota bacterium]